MNGTKCYRCSRLILTEPYQIRLELVNAGPGAPRENVFIEADFHPECAAMIFRIAQGSSEEHRSVAA